MPARGGAMIPDADIPLDLVRRYVEAMSASVGATPAVRWPLLGMAQRVIGIDPSQYATTIGRDILGPAPWGSPELVLLGWSPWAQMSTYAHECEHVRQHDAHGAIAHAWDYLTSPARRVQRECEAMVPQMELEIWRRGLVADWWPRVRAEALRAYLVREADLAVAERHLRALAPTVRAGGLVSRSGAVAIRWLDEHAPELRHPTVAPRRPS